MDNSKAPIVKPHLLIVEDNQLTRLLLFTIFGSMGFEVKELENGSDALPYLQSHKVDVMILDLELPGMTGDQIYAAMKADEELAKIPVIPFTAHQDTQVSGSYSNNLLWTEYQKTGRIPTIVYKLDEKSDTKNITNEIIYEVAAQMTRAGLSLPPDVVTYIFETGGFEGKNQFPPGLQPPI